MADPPKSAHTLVVTPPYERDVRKLCKQNKALLAIVKDMQRVLKKDPYNTSHIYNIKKLTSVAQGEGQYRIRQGDYRIRYDIVKKDVVLTAFKHRKDIY